MYSGETFLTWCCALVTATVIASLLLKVSPRQHPLLYSTLVGISFFWLASIFPLWKVHRIPVSNTWIDVGVSGPLWTALGELPRYLERVRPVNGARTWILGNAIPTSVVFAVSVVLALITYFAATTLKAKAALERPR